MLCFAGWPLPLLLGSLSTPEFGVLRWMAGRRSNCPSCGRLTGIAIGPELRAGIYFYDPESDPASSSLKLYRFATGRVERVLSPAPPPMSDARGLAVSSDGHRVLWVRFSRRISQIMLVDGFR